MARGPSVEIGGYLIQFPHPIHFPRKFRLFQKEPPRKGPVYVLRLSFGLPPPQEKIFYRKRGKLQTSSSSKGFLIKVPQRPSPTHPIRAILLNQKKAQGIIYLKKGTRDLSPYISPILFFIVYYALIKKKGFFLHASSVIDRGKGLLFVGPDGSGKSTIANLFDREKDGVILNDDRTIVRKIGSRFLVFGIPWNGSFQSISACSAPLTAIFFLSQGMKNRLTHLSPKETVKRFLQELYLPPWDPNGHPTLLSLALEVCAKIPSYLLTFTPQKETVHFLRRFFKDQKTRL